jgi:hypothetical protein
MYKIYIFTNTCLLQFRAAMSTTEEKCITKNSQRELLTQPKIERISVDATYERKNFDGSRLHGY